jgi:phytoene/squalene synthetase
MNQWMDVYDSERTRYYLDNWKESIEQDIDMSGEITEEAFQQYLKERDIDFPHLDSTIPGCAKNLMHKEYRSSLALLRKYRSGRYAEWIEPLLTMDAVKQPKSSQDPRDFEDNWDDGPLPTWVLAFRHHDPITQAFDEEAAGMNECSHAPTWIATFNPADKQDVKRILDRVEGFVQVNRQIVKLSKMFEARREPVGNPRKSQLHGQLRAA